MYNQLSSAVVSVLFPGVDIFDRTEIILNRSLFISLRMEVNQSREIKFHLSMLLVRGIIIGCRWAVGIKRYAVSATVSNKPRPSVPVISCTWWNGTPRVHWLVSGNDPLIRVDNHVIFSLCQVTRCSSLLLFLSYYFYVKAANYEVFSVHLLKHGSICSLYIYLCFLHILCIYIQL